MTSGPFAFETRFGPVKVFLRLEFLPTYGGHHGEKRPAKMESKSNMEHSMEPFGDIALHQG
ncbi:BZ3500_MvSof-1268-A1-R1_Chr10-2g03045 [Microbotryum saponariae]|uniref:BZ3500_MvSof-1268-A1-R1_Chr10-2g03045 protein n=1 Tax=Microbotryum saponariae TaxID=289078 RepID=A0A2X0MAA2_9BASI|nr:BZ3501_MvSof-1269-A2-R1_Chr10-2g02631 [Microbotryum saponariae]SDA01984.1 BZ3500_MvSof-1268-A1-R1_Chr10-2g03045 [Microbotryum saponariae]